MEYIVLPEHLQGIWRRLSNPLTSVMSSNSNDIHRQIAETGWGTHADVEDLLWATDGRAEDAFRAGCFKFLEHPHTLVWRPRYGAPFNGNEVYGSKAMDVYDVASLIFQVERLGFSVNIDYLVTSLRPRLLRRKHLTNSELVVLWYNRDRHRGPSVILRAVGDKPDAASTITTQSGYQVTALLAGNRAVSLRVDAPKGKKDLKLEIWTHLEMAGCIKARLIQTDQTT